MAFFSLFFSRLLFVLNNPRPVLHTILGFVLFPYFPGLSLSGGLIGGLLFSYFYLKNRKMPLGRILDFFSLGMLTILPIGYLGEIILTGFSLRPLVLFLLYFIGSVLMLRLLFPLFLRGRIKDGSLSLILITLVSFFTLGGWFLDNNNFSKFIGTENISFIIIICFTLGLFIFKEFISLPKK